MLELYLELQQYLPFTVLKLDKLFNIHTIGLIKLQQYLPFTVLKRDPFLASNFL